MSIIVWYIGQVNGNWPEVTGKVLAVYGNQHG